MAPRKEAPADLRGLDAFQQDLAASGPRPAYLLTGEDRRDLEQALELLQAACVPAGLEAFNATRLRGLDDDAEDVRAACDVMPMGGDRRFVLVRDPEKLGGDLTILAAYCASPCPTTTLALVPTQLDRRLGWVKALEAKAFKADFAPPSGRELEGWIRRELKRHGTSIAPDALALLVDMVSAETIMLGNEIEKLALSRAGAAVSVDDVAAALGRSRTVDAWSLTNAIEDGDREAALGALRRLLDQGEAVPMLVGMLDWCLGRLFASETPRVFPDRQRVIERRREELRGQGERLYGLLRDADRRVRTTGGMPEAALERFVMEASAQAPRRVGAR